MRLNMAVLIGLNALAQAGFDWQKDELHWGFVENRPFMRAYARYAQEIMERYHDIRQVMFIQQRLLKACPTDNLGIRHEYVQSLLFCKKYKEVIKLYKTYPDDFDPQYRLWRGVCVVAIRAKKCRQIPKKSHPRVSFVCQGIIRLLSKP